MCDHEILRREGGREEGRKLISIKKKAHMIVHSSCNTQVCGGKFRVKDKQLEEHFLAQPHAIPLLLVYEEADVWPTPTPPQSTALPAHSIVVKERPF